MDKQLSRPNRKTIRLPNFDYASGAAYFITICARERVNHFGIIHDGVMEKNKIGIMIEDYWRRLSSRYSIDIDEYIVMPNHIHGIVFVQEIEEGTGAHLGAPLQQIIRWFKTMTTNEYIRQVKTNNWPEFHGRLWQRNYYEHVIRSDDDLYNTRKYIQENPLKWALDKENPDNP